MANFRDLPTTLVLSQWDQQSTTAERLCADVLGLAGFEGIDPQLPRGGPDGGKDMLCSKDGTTFVVACYFPHDPALFPSTKAKFNDDLSASLKHDRDGLIFMTNQQLSPGERTELEKLAAGSGKRALIMHREYLRTYLDSPQGYGIRLRHLRIPLSTEEQFAYFASNRDGLAEAISKNTRAIERLGIRLDRSTSVQIGLMMKTAAVIAEAVGEGDNINVSAMLQRSTENAFEALSTSASEAIAGQFSTALIRYVHRKVVTTSVHYAGRYRQTQVWLQDSAGMVNEAFECPSWDQVPRLMNELVADWSRNYNALLQCNQDERIRAIARFMHGLLVIHPFIDGNGRVARELASIQARDLFDLTDDLLLDRGERYYNALRQADGSDFDGLFSLLEDAISSAA